MVDRLVAVLKPALAQVCNLLNIDVCMEKVLKNSGYRLRRC